MKIVVMFLLGVFILTPQTLRADTPQELQRMAGQPDLQMTCSIDPVSIPPAVGFPIWVNVDVTNVGESPFHGSFFGRPDTSMAATVISDKDSGSAAVADMTRRYGWYDGPTIDFYINSGRSYGFRVLLNSLLPITKAGMLSCQIMLPLDPRVKPYEPIVLAAPLSITIEPTVTPARMQAESDSLLRAFESNLYDREGENQEVKALPDADAVPILMRVAKDRGFPWWVTDDLGSRPRTPETTAALQQLAQSTNDDTRKLAQFYLSQSNLQK